MSIYRLLQSSLIAWLMFSSVVALAGPDAAKVAKQLDKLLAEELGHDRSNTAPKIDASLFVRRAYLDITGKIPKPEQRQVYLDDKKPNKRTRLINQLLAQESFGTNQARYWRDVILSRKIQERIGTGEDSLLRDLSKWINEGRPWDAIAREFITAEGKVIENGATAIMLAQDGQTEEVAAEVSRIFLGIQIQCAQCHDHPWDSWEREQFHQLAAFFPRIGVRQEPKSRPPTFIVHSNNNKLNPKRKPPQNINRRGWPEHFMPDLDKPEEIGKMVQPKFFLTGLEKPIGTADLERRQSLADSLTKDPWFSAALVNRVWSELVGEGFYEPIDDIGPERTPTAPKTVKRLAKAFEQSGYDLKWLYRTVMLTEAYQRESRPRRNPSEIPMTASIAQPLRGDVLFDSLLQVLDIKEKSLGRVGSQRGGSPRKVFNASFGYDPSLSRETVVTSIPQTLALMNTPAINRHVRDTKNTMLGKMIRKTKDDTAIVNQLYVKTLSREPTEDELQRALAYRAKMPNSTQPWEDLLWALVNSAEFAHRR